MVLVQISHRVVVIELAEIRSNGLVGRYSYSLVDVAVGVEGTLVDCSLEDNRIRDREGSKTLPGLCVGFFVSSATGSRDLVMIVVNRAFWMSRRARTWASSLKRVGRL